MFKYCAIATFTIRFQLTPCRLFVMGSAAVRKHRSGGEGGHCPNPFQVAPEASHIGCEGVSWPGVPPGVIMGRALEHQMFDCLVSAVAVRADGRVPAPSAFPPWPLHAGVCTSNRPFDCWPRTVCWWQVLAHPRSGYDVLYAAADCVHYRR